MTMFAVELQFDRDEEARLAVRPRHRAYLAELHSDGRLVMAGPFADGSGALLIYDVADEAALEAALADDPYFEGEPVASVARVREWTPLPFD